MWQIKRINSAAMSNAAVTLSSFKTGGAAFESELSLAEPDEILVGSGRGGVSSFSEGFFFFH